MAEGLHVGSALLASAAEGTGSAMGEGIYVDSALLASAAEGTESVVGEGMYGRSVLPTRSRGDGQCRGRGNVRG